MPRIYRNCVWCEAEFYILEKDQDFFLSQCTCRHHKNDHKTSCSKCDCPSFFSLELPKRCWACRQRKKREQLKRSQGLPDDE